MGFIDGINDSLNNQYDLEAIDANDRISIRCKFRNFISLIC